MKLSIVTPCYYNEKNLDDTYGEIVRQVFEKKTGYEWEWVLVDDGSGDGTLEAARRLQEKDARIRIVKLARNFGEFRAIVAGLSVAEGEAVAVISADLQDPPEMIPHMVESWEKGNKVNLAVRGGREESRLKNWFADTYYKLIRRWVIPDYPRRGFDFFVIDRSVAQQLVQMHEKNSSVYLQLIWLGYKPTMIEYTRRERDKGISMWTYSKRINLFVDTFIVFSHRPIRFLTGVGAAVVDHAVAVGKSFRRRDFGDGFKNGRYIPHVFCGNGVGGVHMLLRQDQHVDRRLGIDVPEGIDLVVLIDLSTGDLAGDDFTKQTIVHDNRSFILF